VGLFARIVDNAHKLSDLLPADRTRQMVAGKGEDYRRQPS